jgi:hypothetical protein
MIDNWVEKTSKGRDGELRIYVSSPLLFLLKLSMFIRFSAISFTSMRT